MGTEVYLGMPPANIEQWIEKEYSKEYLTIYKVQTTSQYKKTGIYSAQRNDASKPVRIDWGDGAIEEVDGDVSQKVHEYSDVGEFTVKVSNIKTFAASTSDSTWYNTTSQNRRTLKELVNLNKAVTSIGDFAFYGCHELTSMTIPDSVTRIGMAVFYGCSRLANVTIPDSVTSIGDSAFFECSSLTSVTIPDSVTSIGQFAFEYCSGLTSVTIGNSVTSIGDSAFGNCRGLMSVNITDIAKWCSISFQNNTANPLFYAHNLYLNSVKVTNLAIPDSVTSIGQFAFEYCSGLTSVTIPDGVASIGNYAFSSCVRLTSVTIGNSVTSIESGAFYGCSGLTSVTIPDGVTSIESGAFYGCSGLTSVTIGNGVTSIEDYAFEGCSGLTSVTIPDGVASIGDWAFNGCNGLTSVNFDGTTVPAGGYNCFYDTSNLNDVYMLQIAEADVQAQLDSNISNWSLGQHAGGDYHTVTIHCMDGEVVIDPTPSGSSSSSS